MSGHPSSALILALLGLFSADPVQEPAVPHAPVPQVSASANPADRVQQELAQLERQVRSSIASHSPIASAPSASSAPPTPSTTPAAPAPSSASANLNRLGSQVPKAEYADGVKPVGAPVTLTPLDTTYIRLSLAQISPAARAQVQTLAKAHQPKASGKDGVPIDWLPRETRKALGGNGPRDVVLLAATEAFAWYAWAEADAAWIGRVDLADFTKIQAGPLPVEGAFIVPGPETLIDEPGQPLTVIDSNDYPITLISR